MKKYTLLWAFVALFFITSSCGNRYSIPEGDIDYLAKIEYLKTRCKDDNQLVARLLNIRYSQLDSITTQKVAISDQDQQRIDEVYSYATTEKVSLTKIKAEYDTGLKWYDHILYWPVTHPWWFWGITLFLLVFFILNRLDAATDAVVTSPYTLSGIGGFLARVFFFIKNGFAIEILLYIIVIVLHFVL